MMMRPPYRRPTGRLAPTLAKYKYVVATPATSAHDSRSRLKAAAASSGCGTRR